MRALEKLHKRRVRAAHAITQDFATQLTFISQEINRVVAVLIDRKGRVTEVMVGDTDRVYLPDIGRQRAGSRFRGIRLVRTYLRDPRHIELTQDDFTDLSQLRLDMVLAVGVGAAGYPGAVSYAYLVPENPEGKLHETVSMDAPSALEHELDYAEFITELEGEFSRKTERTTSTGATPAMLVFVATPEDRGEDVELAEMQELCRTAGVDIVETVVQRRTALHPKFAIGKGKIEDVTQSALQRNVDLLIFGQDLNPGQMRAITRETDLKVVDRTQLILDIFAQHAKSKDGRLQVELAQLRYNLPRLSDRDTGMSRLTGGIGGRGPGETKLEINRRRARDRIRQLEKAIAKMSDQRALTRGRRQASALPVVSIVGYTNAGKSTLLNQLTSSEVLSEDKLFATLRPTSRRLELEHGRTIIFTDTVGFIHDLPEELVNAFKATLEELAEADLLLHVADVSDPEFVEHIEAVSRILGDLELGEKEQMLVLNKRDRVDDETAQHLERRFDALAVSALDRASLRPLIERVDQRLRAIARARAEAITSARA